MFELSPELKFSVSIGKSSYEDIAEKYTRNTYQSRSVWSENLSSSVIGIVRFYVCLKSLVLLRLSNGPLLTYRNVLLPDTNLLSQV